MVSFASQAKKQRIRSPRNHVNDEKLIHDAKGLVKAPKNEDREHSLSLHQGCIYYAAQGDTEMDASAKGGA